jgi:hypothetical protein
MLRLIVWRMQDCKGYAEQLARKGARRLIPTLALEPEVIAQDAPRRL